MKLKKEQNGDLLCMWYIVTTQLKFDVQHTCLFHPSYNSSTHGKFSNSDLFKMNIILSYEDE